MKKYTWVCVILMKLLKKIKVVFKKYLHTHTHVRTYIRTYVLEHICGLLTSGLNWKYIPVIDSDPLKVPSPGTDLF